MNLLWEAPLSIRYLGEPSIRSVPIVLLEDQADDLLLLLQLICVSQRWELIHEEVFVYQHVFVGSLV